MPSDAPNSDSLDVSAELDRFREKLLDLANSNRLLSYRKSKTRTIQIVDELPNQIFDRLVLKEKSFSFLPSKEESDEDELASSDPGQKRLASIDAMSELDEDRHELPEHSDDDQRIARRHTDDKLQTDLTDKRLDRVLTTMRQQAGAAIEETGVNYLYLALGMLEWRARESSERALLAPLILVPVRLDRAFDKRANKYRITVSYTGEDIQQNLCLAKRLKNDFELVLPEYEADDDDTPALPDSYFSTVSAAIAGMPNWRIRREALIGFFSFRKLLMYLDLDTNRWQDDQSPEKHPLVRAVIEGTQVDETPGFYGQDYEIDEYANAQKIALVRDADSSQHSALCDIAEGKSLVIEGPPGTGKSQTITNAIANALNDGKSVLFVAEKLAALDVVRSNLEKTGLGLFCLELHSEAANPRDVFADLGRRLNATFQSPAGIESLQTQVDSLKTKLKNYLEACALRVGPHEKPLHEVFWRISELRSRGIDVLPNSLLDTSINELQFGDRMTCLMELSQHAEELGSPAKISWNGFNANRLPPTGHRTVGNLIEQMREIASGIQETGVGLNSRFGGDLRFWVALAEQLSDEFLDGLVIPPNYDPSLLPFLSSLERCETGIAAAKAVADARESVDRISNTVVGELDDVRATATELAETIGPSLHQGLRGISLDSGRQLRSQLETTLRCVHVVETFATTLVELGFGEITSLRDFNAALYKYKLVSHLAVTPPRTLCEAHFLSGAVATAQRAKAESDELALRRGRLNGFVFTDKLPDDSTLEELTDSLQAFGGSWTRFFYAKYRKARRQLAAFSKSTARRTTNEKWIKILREARQFRQDLQRFTDNADFRRYLGPLFDGVDTNWEQVKVAFDWVATAKKVGLSYQQASGLVDKRWNDSRAPDPSDLSVAEKNLRHELEIHSTTIATGSVGDSTESPHAQQQKTAEQLYEAGRKSFEKASPDFVDTALDGKDAIRAEIEKQKSLLSSFLSSENYSRKNFDLELRKLGELDRQLKSVDGHTKNDAIARTIMQNNESLPLSRLKVILTEQSQALDRIFELRQDFRISDSIAIGELCDHAERVVKVLSYRDQLKSDTTFCQAFPDHFKGSETDVLALEVTSRWVHRLFKLGFSGEAVQRIAGDTTGTELHNLVEQIRHLRQSLGSWTDTRKKLSEFGTLDSSWLALPGTADDVVQLNFLERLRHDMAYLQPWAAFRRALDRSTELGLNDFVSALCAESANKDTLAASYDLTFHEQLAAESLEKADSLRNFSRQGAEQSRRQFQQLDRKLIEANQAAIASSASRRNVPQGVATGRVKELTELSLIRHEVGKQRRHCRIRDLIYRAGRAVQALKPCFMMSPLSIAQYLPAGCLEFDLVVMDEASQIKPEDALGTLMRAKQIVIVGDPKQLPPTSFFDRISDTEEGDDSTFMDDTESILEVSLKAFPNRRRLRWHYRSQHESLIAFSNEKFYDGDLVVFPSPTSAAGRLGLCWRPVEGASFVGGCNPVEAHVVAEAIVRHAMEHPDETLGVAAFNAKQAQAIQDRLDEIVSNSSEARLALERLMEHHDKLFVKNLENVQGDERDVIFISFTYGPDPASGKVMNRFGPMTSQNGWRRLNVLVTRAKRRVEVFSSMTPTDIKGGADRSRGVNAMKDYLHYVMTGQLVDRGSPNGRPPDSPFEISVARVVEQMGLKVVPQVGVAGYFVDLGVLKPETQGEFLLGIECDGATYHSSKSARDRDRLREEVIVSRGWKLHRIWSTDWFLNHGAEELRLQQAIRRELEIS